MPRLPKYVNALPTKRTIGGEEYYFHTAHSTRKEAEDLAAWLRRKHPRKYSNTQITHDPDGIWRLWAKRWW